MRLIDADELRRKMYYKCIDTDEEMKKGRAKWDSGLWIRYKVFEDTLILTPTVDAEPVKHGHWEWNDYGGFGNYHCTICKYIPYGKFSRKFSPDYMYCPRCGAKMDDVSEDES